MRVVAAVKLHELVLDVVLRRWLGIADDDLSSGEVANPRNPGWSDIVGIAVLLAGRVFVGLQGADPSMWAPWYLSEPVPESFQFLRSLGCNRRECHG